MEAKNKTNVLANRNKLLWFILSLIGLLFISTQTSVLYFGAPNPWGQKTHALLSFAAVCRPRS